MRLITLSALLLPMALSPPVGRPGQTPTGIVNLATLRGSERPLLLFASRPDDPQLEIQLRTLHENAAAVAERDIVAIAVAYESPSPTAATLTPGDATASDGDSMSLRPISLSF